MKRIRFAGTVLLSGVLLLSISEALACRYNVRETGFVDLGLDQYRLLCLVDPGTPDETREALSAAAANLFSDLPISLGIQEWDPSFEDPAFTVLDPLTVSTPAAVLLSPDSHTLDVGLLWTDNFSEEQVRKALARVADSPIRSRITEGLATSFGVVLFVEGDDLGENRRVEMTVAQALSAVEAELEYFPKPIRQGPIMIRLTQSELESDPVLMWSLHLDSHALQDPVLAVLYGRGRWIGPLMTGREIQLDLLTQILFVIGADCECGLDPRLIRGTAIPISWNREMRDLVARDLGFDPDNPLVRIEVGQILRTNKRLDMRSLSADDPVLNFEIPASGSRSKSQGTIPGLFLMVGGMAVIALLIGAWMLVRSQRGQH
ncbi:MAG: hypothetical protein JSU96_03950 [Acidobacteriota bacterium]|nr:MAG: hypothetical protein JSU96_03950 [Acidobacteriota bacterium]